MEQLSFDNYLAAQAITFSTASAVSCMSILPSVECTRNIRAVSPK